MAREDGMGGGFRRKRGQIPFNEIPLHFLPKEVLQAMAEISANNPEMSEEEVYRLANWNVGESPLQRARRPSIPYEKGNINYDLNIPSATEPVLNRESANVYELDEPNPKPGPLQGPPMSGEMIARRYAIHKQLNDNRAALLTGMGDYVPYNLKGRATSTDLRTGEKIPVWNRGRANVFSVREPEPKKYKQTKTWAEFFGKG